MVSREPARRAGIASQITDQLKSMPSPVLSGGAGLSRRLRSFRSALRRHAEPLLVDGIVGAIRLQLLEGGVHLLGEFAALGEGDAVFMPHHLLAHRLD